MRIRVLAAGTRMPEWVESGVADYARRFDAQFKFEIQEIPLGRRAGGGDSARAIAEEGKRMLAAITDDDFVVSLDSRGKVFTTEQLAIWLKGRLQSRWNLALLIGGPDGLSQECTKRSDLRWSLSALTLPHALVRIVLAEQLYRAQSILKGHPYHRA